MSCFDQIRRHRLPHDSQAQKSHSHMTLSPSFEKTQTVSASGLEMTRVKQVKQSGCSIGQHGAPKVHSKLPRYFDSA
jgi:hypothetical protein